MIIFDMDNTICRTNEYFLANLNTRFGKSFEYREELLSSFHLTEYIYINYGVPMLEARAMKEQIFADVDYWASIPPMDGAIETIMELSHYNEILIASDALTVSNEECMIGKKKWMKRWLPTFGFSTLVFIHNKGNLKGDFLIEDAGEQIEDFKGKTILFDYPYNRFHKPDYRVSNWLELEKVFEQNKCFE
jgi:5'(3')-deoxyribonucleotidase